MDYILLGKRIREERQLTGFTQEQLADTINISTAYMGQIERGERKVTLDKLVLIAEKLQVTLDYLLKDDTSYNCQAGVNRLTQLLEDKTQDEVELAYDVLSRIFTYTSKR